MNLIKTAVLLHKLGLLDPAQSDAMELARENDAVMRDQFRLLDPNAIEPSLAMLQMAKDIALNGIADGPSIISLDDFREQTKNGTRVAADSPIRSFDEQSVGGFQGKWDLRLILAGAPASNKYPLAGDGTVYLSQNGPELNLDCPADLIPHGLGILYFVDANGIVRSTIPRLKFDRGSSRWWFNSTVNELFGVQFEEIDAIVTPRFLPVTVEEIDRFDITELRRFVVELDEDGRQRQLAQKFLESLEK